MCKQLLKNSKAHNVSNCLKVDAIRQLWSLLSWPCKSTFIDVLQYPMKVIIKPARMDHHYGMSLSNCQSQDRRFWVGTAVELFWILKLGDSECWSWAILNPGVGRFSILELDTLSGVDSNGMHKFLFISSRLLFAGNRKMKWPGIIKIHTKCL